MLQSVGSKDMAQSQLELVEYALREVTRIGRRVGARFRSAFIPTLSGIWAMTVGRVVLTF